MLTGTEFTQAINKMQEDLERLQIPEETFMEAADYIISHLTDLALREGNAEKIYKKFLKELKKQSPVMKKALLLACVIFAHAAAKGLYILLSEKEKSSKDINNDLWETFPLKDEDAYDLIEYVIKVTDEDTVTLINELLECIDSSTKMGKNTETDDLDDPRFKLEIICYMAVAGPLMVEKFAIAKKIKPLINQ